MENGEELGEARLVEHLLHKVAQSCHIHPSAILAGMLQQCEEESQTTTGNISQVGQVEQIVMVGAFIQHIHLPGGLVI